MVSNRHKCLPRKLHNHIKKGYIMKTISKFVAIGTILMLFTLTLSAEDYFRIKNRWTGQYLHIEHKKGHAELARKVGGWHSAQWTKENSGNGYFRIKNRWTGQYLHIEHKKGHLELGKTVGDWWSAQWKKENVAKGYFRISNKWTKQYMHIEGKLGHVQLNKTGPTGGWWSSQWKFEKVRKATPTNYTLKCLAGGNMGLHYSAASKKVTINFSAGATGTRDGNLQRGQCSWVDRRLRGNEPKKICQLNVNDVIMKVRANSYASSSRKAPYISKIKQGGTFSLKVHNDNRGCMVVDKVLR
ncbi:MAG: Unknown protein [uncultured Sulfurovum sp.]|uniref:Ricin B lectin domain-containing protein n=1 Tax=uncultured Sulfurovum sp. TaxID=269237 RepID=A0A6S6SWL6_9BACT|nr:MAG: Unknown protein [uncultured Sulfurovum sp.]